jgi:hypothetical protein
MPRMSALLPVAAVVAGCFVSPLWARPHHFYHYREGMIEAVSVEEGGSLRVLNANDISPAQPGTRYVIALSSGATRYSGEFYVKDVRDYPITLRSGQKVRFRAFQYQVLACDVHNVMTLVTVNALGLREPRGQEWELFVSSDLPPDFNADIRPGGKFGASPH